LPQARWFSLRPVEAVPHLDLKCDPRLPQACTVSNSDPNQSVALSMGAEASC